MPIEALHCGNKEFRIFLQKIVEIIKFFGLHPKGDVAVAETHFLTHYRLFYFVCYQSYTHSKCFFTPNLSAWSLPVTWQRWRSHHSIHNGRKPPAICKLHESFIEPELLPIEVLHCGNREFHVFCKKIVEIIKNFCSHPKKDVAVAKTHFLTHYRLFYLVFQNLKNSLCWISVSYTHLTLPTILRV